MICKKEPCVLKVVCIGHCDRQMQMSLVGSVGFLFPQPAFTSFFFFFRVDAAHLSLQSSFRHTVEASTDFFTISYLCVPLDYQAHQDAPTFL